MSIIAVRALMRGETHLPLLVPSCTVVWCIETELRRVNAVNVEHNVRVERDSDG